MTTFDDHGPSLLDLCEAPDGFRYHSGVWLTHDVNWTFVAHTVAPALAGVVGQDAGRRYRLARATEGMELLILACPGRIRFGPIHTWAAVHDVVGRRQHAKLGVLHFRADKGTKTVTRAFLGSANVTAGGALHNRELLLTDEVSGSSGRPSLVVDVLKAIDALGRADVVAPDVQQRLRSITRDVRARLSSRLSGTGLLVHSLDGQRPLVDALAPRRGRRVTRIVVVSPGHTTDGAGLIAHLAGKGLLTAKPVIDVFAPSSGRSVTFEPTAVEALQAAGCDVRLHAVDPLDADQQGTRARPLHAKLVATVDDRGDVSALVGSANFSTAGLLGGNREAVVKLSGTEADLDALLVSLDHDDVDDVEQPPPRVADSVTRAHIPKATPRFDAHHLSSDGRMVIGRLDLTAFEAAGFTVLGAMAGGEELDLSGGDIAIPVRNAEVVVRVRRPDGSEDSHSYQLGAGHVPEGGGIWRADPDEPPPRTDAWLGELLGDMRLAARQQAAPDGSSPSKPGNHRDDAYRIPLERRLALMARHRRALRVRGASRLEAAIDEYLDDPEERRIARALLLRDADGDPLLHVVAAFDTEARS